MSCVKCKHISARGKWKEGELVGKIYSCDLNQFEPQENFPSVGCESFDEHLNQRILGEYLLNLRVDK